jgi:hypothetical protein
MKSPKNRYPGMGLGYGNGSTSLHGPVFHPISRRCAVSSIIILFLGFIAEWPRFEQVTWSAVSGGASVENSYQSTYVRLLPHPLQL